MSVEASGGPSSAAGDVLARVVERVRAGLAGTAVASQVERGELALELPAEQLRPAVRLLRDDPELAFTRLVDICGVDRLGLGRQPRFAVVYHLHSLRLGCWVRFRVPVAEDDAVPSLVEEWPAADWYEREAFDLFGIRFAGHPSLTRLLLPDEWEGHPLRKDYPFEEEPVEYSFNSALRSVAPVDRVNAGRVVRR